MDVSTFADWVLVLLGLALCLLGLAVVGYSIHVQVKDKEAIKDFRWTPVILGGLLMWLGASLVGNFDNFSDDETTDSTQGSSR